MKRISCLLLFILFFTKNYAQTTGMNGYLPNYDPPSPEASALGKYVEHPIGNFTGTPKIEVPLFEIKTGRITVPISLSYHGSGVKIDEVASRTGIGWVLNAGGAITKTAKGFPDDFTEGTLPAGTNVIDYFDNIGLNRSNDAVVVETTGHGSTTLYDLEPDPHFYNFGNKSGTMYFSDRGTAFTVDNDPMKIDGPYNGNDRFIITNDDGLVYTFEAAEKTNLVTDGSSRYTSAWYLTKIYDPVTDKSVIFTYRTDISSTLNYNYQKSVSMSNPCGGSVGFSTTLTQHYNIKILDRISYDQGYIEFKADHNRQDLTGDKAYTEINQYVNGNVPLLKKGFNLSYTYTSNGSAQENKRLYLESVQEKGSDNSLLPPYLFYYKNREQVPERNSPQQDIWGFYNANNVPVTDFPQYPKVYVHNTFGKGNYLPFDNPATPATTTIPGIERSSNPATIDYGTLNKIIYPTQGYTTYAYEVHQFNGFNGGGIRVREIDDYDATGIQVLAKTYSYTNGFLGGPYPQVAYPTSGQGLIRFSENQSVLGSSQGNYVGYERVTIQQIGLTGNNNGTTIYVYSTDNDVEGNFAVTTNGCSALSNLSDIRSNSYFPFFEMESREERRGVLNIEAYYDNANRPLKSIIYNYSLSSKPKIKVYSSYKQYVGHEILNVQVNLNSTRNISAERMLLTSKIENEWVGATSTQDPIAIQSQVDYSYTNGEHEGQFLRSETNYGSITTRNLEYDPREENPRGPEFLLDRQTSTFYEYPFDFQPTASGGIMGRMTTMNYINPVISKISQRIVHVNSIPAAGEYASYYSSGQINNYKQNVNFSGTNALNAIVPAEVYKLNLNSPLSEDNGDSAEVGDPSNPGAHYEKRLEHLTFDGNSNPTSIIYDGLYDQLEWSGFGELLSKTHAANSTGTTGQKTIYTYDQFHRLQSIKDPANKLRSFEYDPFNRLINTKDNNGYILEHNEYHFKQ